MYHNGAIMTMKAEIHAEGQYTEIDVKGMM